MRKCASCPEMFQPSPGAQERKVGAGYSYCKGCRSTKRKAQWRDDRASIAESNRRSRIRNTYGMEPEQYNAMLAKQGGGCAICGRKSGRLKSGGMMSVDHCHDTGRIRGLLCQPCNSALGLFDDDPQTLRAAADYLEMNT